MVRALRFLSDINLTPYRIGERTKVYNHRKAQLQPIKFWIETYIILINFHA